MPSVEDIINQALRRISYPTPIGFIYEGSPAARVAVEIYGQTRDDLLRSQDWPFARQSAALQVLKTAPPNGYGVTPWNPDYPPLPWIYEYAYPVQPTACLRVRAVRPTPIFIPELDPQPNIFVVADDYTLAPPTKVILTNLVNAVAVYTGQITEPATWEPMFTEALIDALAARLGPSLGAAGGARPEGEERTLVATEQVAAARAAQVPG